MKNCGKTTVRKLNCSYGKVSHALKVFIMFTTGISNLKKVSALWYLVMVHRAGGFLQRLKVALGDENRFFLKV